MKEKYKSNKLDGKEIEVNEAIKELCSKLDSYITLLVADCREKDVALTRLEECAMWATKAVAFNGVK